MTRRDAWVAILFALALGLGYLWWSSRSGEVELVEEQVPLRGAARRNPTLAAGRLLAAMGLPVKATASLARAPDPGDVVLLMAPRLAFGTLRTSALLAWVEAGGHVIVRAADGDDDPLLDALELTVSEVSTAPEPDAVVAATVSLELPQQPALELGVYSDGVLELARAAEWTARDSDGDVRIAHLRHGAGRITVFADATCFTFRHIGDLDHAEALSRLVQLTGRPGTVWIVWDDELPGLLTLAWEHARPVLVAGCALLVLWLWRRAARFGPLLPAPTATRRSLREQLAATGRFLWRSRAHAPMVTAARAAALHAAPRRAAETERLAARPVAGPHDFIDLMRDLEAVRRKP